MTKHPYHHAYPEGSTDLAVSALLTVWSSLADYHDDIVLVGGLVPKFLCVHRPEALPAVTMDVDLGIALGATGGQYGTISSHLKALGFKAENRRFRRDLKGLALFVDFLTEAEKPGQASAMVDDIPVSSFPGINRALAIHRIVKVNGTDVFGGQQSCAIKVCEAGPFLVLKLNAFAYRQQPKDAFDIYQTVLHYDDGADATAKGFRAEAECNSGFKVAVDTLAAHFTTANGAGPARCAEFMIGGLAGQVPQDDFIFRRNQIQNEMLSAAELLLR
ncbi:hypothetical protein OpiT1DRAFT_03399 [Opitutaceae bacterium TAV1]|nr:hypothetical protein OpiT1DRAFT_03399 [Opitutaceae bacterium TAV1]